MISLVYCIFVVCANRLICGAQFNKEDIAERGRPAVISTGPKNRTPGTTPRVNLNSLDYTPNYLTSGKVASMTTTAY
jgi:hypothetical protein